MRSTNRLVSDLKFWTHIFREWEIARAGDVRWQEWKLKPRALGLYGLLIPINI